MGPSNLPTSTTSDPDPASRVHGRGRGRRHGRTGRLSTVAAVGLIVILAAGCMFFPDGSWTTKDPIAGKPALAWNDPDDGLTDSPIDLDDVGYVEAEHFIGGNAAAYARVVGTPWEPDGRWQVQPATSKGFATRILVRRPADPVAFNGVVVVEWLNVTSGSDLDALFRPTHTELLKKGYAWVGVSAQQVGVDELKQRDPNRYKNLQHPGDAYAYDIFTRAGRIVTDPTSPVLGGLHPKVALASGSSQSASMLLTYINAVHPLVKVYDGFQLQSHLGSGGSLRDGTAMPERPIVRTDIDVPVLDVQSETDIVALRTHLNRQEDHPNFRLWELAGSGHIGEYGRSLTWPPNPTTPGDPCVERINSAPTFALGKAATAALARWATVGVAPPSAPRIQLGDPLAADPVARDQYGNALGGIRYPHLDVPIARIDGVRNTAPTSDPIQGFLCALSGRTLPFSDVQLAELYPTAGDYVAQFSAAADQAVDGGFLLHEDAKVLKHAAAASPPVD
jgi:Alpha/beta hydrolase domain